MDFVTLRFTSKWPYNPSSLLIARLTGSKQFSHVMTIIDSMAFEATMLHGCRAVGLDTAMEGVVMYQDMQVPVSDLNAAHKFGWDQVGKPYDFPGAFGLPLLQSDNWSDDRKWWCSELCFAQVMAGGTNMLDPEEKKRVTPNDLHQCDYVKSEIYK